MSAAHTTKRHMNLMSVIVFVLGLLLVSGNAVFAVPFLQLDAEPAIYDPDPDEESVITWGHQFTVYALVDPSNTKYVPDDMYYLSIALVPQLDTPTGLGFFLLDGVTINVTGDMTFGIPPIFLADTLSPHSIFETYFIEIPFPLTPSGTSAEYNVQDSPGGPALHPVTDPDNYLVYEQFAVDVSDLSDAFFLHFDLFTQDETGIRDFAPFSKDLQHVPVPGAVLLGMLGMGVAGLKLRKFS